ncbi:FadR/GntR family transcriptional regulator [Caldimonas tepidiphila]|uniref:FadR/GntR family transcriptional regulator n=1 Tax=Caldimonas tepidiphila TaxID=2315841 RepID=UPI000E5A6419|nr:FadR/GntR family transcriptional regulator [Caldimonas tepidiphila]
MPIQSIEPRRLYRQIADQLRALIRSGEFPVGSRLPPERELATQFGVSRPSVREALIALEVEGLVEVRVGSGIHVLESDSEPSPRLDNAFGPFEIIRARQVVECQMAAIAASSMNRAQLDGLRESLALMDAAIGRGEMPLRADRLFHVRIAEAADNGPLLRIVSELFDERNNPLFQQLGQHFENEPSWRTALAEHQAVVDAIAAHDPAGASAAMHAHLQNSHDRFAAAWPTAPECEPLAR